MDIIKITNEHRLKLIEIAKELYPEYKYIYFNYDVDNIDSDYISLYKKKRPKGYYDGIYLHWFEFIILYVSKDLNIPTQLLITQTRHISKPYEGFDLDHPIDYIYKKINENK